MDKSEDDNKEKNEIVLELYLQIYISQLLLQVPDYLSKSVYNYKVYHF